MSHKLVKKRAMANLGQAIDETTKSVHALRDSLSVEQLQMVGALRISLRSVLSTVTKTERKLPARLGGMLAILALLEGENDVSIIS